MTFLTNKQVAMLESAINSPDINIQDLYKIVGTRLNKETVEAIVDEFAYMPLVNVASQDDILKAVEKCDNTNK